ncbi:MAG: hypothetical protein AB7O43_17700 [Hyphomicrobiaceae bacterium]
MTAETLTQSPLAKGPTHGYAGNLKRQYFYYELAGAVEDGDIFELGYLPGNILVVGGHIATDDIDTGTEALDIDVGYAAAGEATDTWTDPNTGVTFTNAAASAAAAGFCNSGVLSGDGITDLLAAGVNYRPFVFPVPLFFSAKTMVQIEANAAAGGGHTGTFGVYIDYICI